MRALRPAALFAALVGLAGCGGTPEGPLADHVHRTFVHGPVAVGQPWTWGIVVLMNPTRRRIMLDRVELVDRTRGLRVLRIQTAGVRRGTTIGSAYGFPKLRDLHPLRGTVVAKRGTPGTEILVTVAAPRVGVFGFHGIRIDYHSGGHRYSTVLGHGAGICAPRFIIDCDARLKRAGIDTVG